MMDELILAAVTIVVLAIWCLIIGTIVLAGLAIWWIVQQILRKIRPAAADSRFGRRWLRLSCVVLVFALVFCLAENPPLVETAGLEVPLEEMPEDMRDYIVETNNGLYNNGLPLIPIRIEVLEYDGERVLVRTCYFPAGTVEREHGPDGPSITKPLN